VREAIRLIEAAAARALRGAAAEPVLGGREAGAVPPGAHPVLAERYGAVQMIDAPALQTLGEEIGADIHVALRVGAQTHPTRPLLHVAFDDEAADLTAETARRLRACFVIGLQRTFEHDPRFGLIAISEIASRALSPAINDPGTAIEAIDAQTRLLAVWAEAAQDRDAADGEGEGEPARPRLHAPSVGPQALLRDAFRASARDGAGTVEVAVRLQKALGALAAAAPERLGAPARAESAAAAARAAAALGHSVDREAVEAARRAAGLAA
jgi:uncharacterized membrane protein